MKHDELYNSLVDCFSAKTELATFPHLSKIIPAGSLSPVGALEVYRNAYQARLTDALGETYQILWNYLGDKAFFKLCREFLISHCSTYWDISDFGVEVPDFILTQSHLLDEDPFLADLADLCWRHRCLFHTKSQSAVNLEAIDLSNEALSIKLGPHNIVKSTFSLFEIWSALIEKRDLDFQWWHPEQVIIYRSGEQVFIKKIGDSLAFFLADLEEGFTLNQVFEAVERREGSGAIKVVEESFAFLALSGLVVAKI